MARKGAKTKRMKFTKEMQDRIVKWVELNGLYPQPCGATRQSLCNHCGIDDKTLKRWEQNSAFSARLSCARAKFAATVEVEIVNALVKNATGPKIERIKEKAKAEKIVETDKDGNKTERIGELKTVEAYRETYSAPGDTKAAQFLLTNLAPERWKLKREHTVDTTGAQITMNITQEAFDGLSKAIETGAKPRAPKGEE